MSKTKHATIITTVLMLLVISTIAPAMAQVSITVTTDKTAYTPGQTLVVSGTVSEITAGQDVAISVKNPAGSLKAVGQATPGEGGAYSKDIMVFAPTDPTGVWTVTATYQSTSASTSFTYTGVAPRTSILPTVTAEVGTTYARGETADAYILVTYMGGALDANVTATLYRPGTLSSVALTSTHTATGLYKISYAIPSDAATGTYVLLANATILTAAYDGKGAAVKSFQVSQTLTTMASDVATMKTEVTAAKNDAQAAKSSVDSVKSDVTGIATTVDSVKSDVAGVKSDVAGVKSDVAGVKTEVDTLTSNLEGVSSGVSSVSMLIYVAVALSLVAAIAAVYAVIVIHRKIAA